jgi:hypothetical protein
MLADEIIIPARFNGPPASANGGYACGAVAAAIGPSATVRLSQPPPLDVPMTLRRDDDGAVRLLHRSETIAVGRAGRPQVEPPAPPTLSAAAYAARGFAGLRPGHHPFPTCFVCGSQRGADGLRIFAGPLGRRGVIAGPWIPTPDLASDGLVDPRFVWAALDCPSGFACMPPRSQTVLATMTATLEAPVRPGREYVVTAWPIASEGRKHRAGSVLHEPDGRRVAVAEAIWITLRG